MQLILMYKKCLGGEVWSPKQNIVDVVLFGCNHPYSCRFYHLSHNQRTSEFIVVSDRNTATWEVGSQSWVPVVIPQRIASVGTNGAWSWKIFCLGCIREKTHAVRAQQLRKSQPERTQFAWRAPDRVVPSNWNCVYVWFCLIGTVLT